MTFWDNLFTALHALSEFAGLFCVCLATFWVAAFAYLGFWVCFGGLSMLVLL